MADLVVRHNDIQELFHDLGSRLRQVLSFDLILFSLHNPATNRVRLAHSHPPEAGITDLGELPLDEAPSGWVWQNQLPLIVPNVVVDTRFKSGMAELRSAGIESYCCIP